MSIKSITVDNSKIPEDYSPHEIKDANTARAASIHLLFSHVADFHKIIVKIIAEKYKINEDEIYETIINHPKYKNMTVNPVIYGLTLIDQEDINKASLWSGVEEVVTNEVIEPPADTPVKVKVVRKKKADIKDDMIKDIIKDDIDKPLNDIMPQKMKIVRKKKAVADVDD
jgi:hypothetical protein